jgi:hypothetical protein
MPQVVFAVIAGAGFYAATRWFARALEAQEELTRRRAHDATQHSGGRAAGPRDLGALEWDERAGVYRPRTTN